MPVRYVYSWYLNSLSLRVTSEAEFVFDLRRPLTQDETCHLVDAIAEGYSQLIAQGIEPKEGSS